MILIQCLMIWYSCFIDYWAIRVYDFVFHRTTLDPVFFWYRACVIFLIFIILILICNMVHLDMSANGLYTWSRTSWSLLKGCVTSVWNGNTILHKSRHIQKLHCSLIFPNLEMNCAKIRSFVMYVIYELSLWIIQ